MYRRKPSAEIFEGDLCDPASVEQFFCVPEGTRTICLHIARLLSLDIEYNQKVMDVNVGGCRNILDSCVRHTECEKLVYVSSTGAIPELPHGKKITEVNHFDPDQVLGCYSKSKAIATQLVLDTVKDYELNGEYLDEESRIMKKSFKDHGYENLFLPSEIKQDSNRKNESE